MVALEDEKLSVVLGRLRAVGGFANLFVKGAKQVWTASVIEANCAINTPDDDMTGDESPGPAATVGMFLDYVAERPHGVALSAAVGQPAYARDAHLVDFTATTAP